MILTAILFTSCGSSLHSNEVSATTTTAYVQDAVTPLESSSESIEQIAIEKNVSSTTISTTLKRKQATIFAAPSTDRAGSAAAKTNMQTPIDTYIWTNIEATTTTTNPVESVETTTTISKESTETETTTATTYEWNGPVLTPQAGVVYGPSGKETYYNLDMSGVVSIMRDLGYSAEEYPYWIRADGLKMLGPWGICAANLDIRPRGTVIATSLGWCIVCDTGGFIYSDPYQLDLAVSW